MKLLLPLIITIFASAASCGPHLVAGAEFGADCFDGCDRTYNHYKNKWKGESGDDGKDSESTNTVSQTVVIKEEQIVGPAGESVQGSAGKAGQNAEATIVDLPTKGACVEVTEGLYIEREGSSHVDVYSNDQCNHVADPYNSSGVWCNNLYTWKSCFLQLNNVIYQVAIQGYNSDMQAMVLEYPGN